MQGLVSISSKDFLYRMSNRLLLGTIQLASEQLNPEKKKIFKRMMNPGESEATEEELLKLASKKDPAKQPLLYQRHRGGSSQDPQQGDQSAGDIESGQISRGGSGAQGTSGFHPLQVEDSPPKRNMGQTGKQSLSQRHGLSDMNRPKLVAISIEQGNRP